MTLAMNFKNERNNKTCIHS